MQYLYVGLDNVLMKMPAEQSAPGCYCPREYDPNNHLIYFLHNMDLFFSLQLTILSDIPDIFQRKRERWLDRHMQSPYRLIMRSKSDFRPAWRFKFGVVSALTLTLNDVAVIDDDPKVVDAMRAAGCQCFLYDEATDRRLRDNINEWPKRHQNLIEFLQRVLC